jgi:hypothetical protein
VERYATCGIGARVGLDWRLLLGGVNRYIYALSNPVNLVDQYGLLCLGGPIVNAAIAGAVGGAIAGLPGGPGAMAAGAAFGGLSGAVAAMAENNHGPDVANAAGAMMGAAMGYAARGSRAQGRNAVIATALGASAGAAAANQDFTSAMSGAVGGVAGEMLNRRGDLVGNLGRAFKAGPSGFLGGLVESALKKFLDEYASDCGEQEKYAMCMN